MNIRALDNIPRYFHRMGDFMVGDGILPTDAEHSTVPSIYWRWSGSVSSYHPVTSYYNKRNTATCSVWTSHTLHSLHVYQFSEPAVNTAHLTMFRSHTFFSLPMPQSLPDEETFILRWTRACQPVTIVILPRHAVSKGNMTLWCCLMTRIPRQPSDHTTSLSCLITLNSSVKLQHTTSQLVTSHTLSLIFCSLLSVHYIVIVVMDACTAGFHLGFSPMRGFSTPWGFPLVCVGLAQT